MGAVPDPHSVIVTEGVDEEAERTEDRDEEDLSCVDFFRRLTNFRRSVLGCIDSYDSERERDRSNILRKSLTATCDDGTCRPASERE